MIEAGTITTNASVTNLAGGPVWFPNSFDLLQAHLFFFLTDIGYNFNDAQAISADLVDEFARFLDSDEYCYNLSSHSNDISGSHNSTIEIVRFAIGNTRTLKDDIISDIAIEIKIFWNRVIKYCGVPLKNALET